MSTTQQQAMMLKSATERILVADHTKFGETAFTKVADWSQITKIVTDKKPGAKWMQEFEKYRWNASILEKNHKKDQRKGEKRMSLVTSEQMLLDAQKGGYAVGAFNVENMEMVKAVIQAAEEMKAPVMLQTTPSTVKYGTLETYFAMVAAEAKKAICAGMPASGSWKQF